MRCRVIGRQSGRRKVTSQRYKGVSCNVREGGVGLGGSPGVREAREGEGEWDGRIDRVGMGVRGKRSIPYGKHAPC